MSNTPLTKLFDLLMKRGSPSSADLEVIKALIGEEKKMIKKAYLKGSLESGWEEAAEEYYKENYESNSNRCIEQARNDSE